MDVCLSKHLHFHLLIKLDRPASVRSEGRLTDRGNYGKAGSDRPEDQMIFSKRMEMTDHKHQPDATKFE